MSGSIDPSVMLPGRKCKCLNHTKFGHQINVSVTCDHAVPRFEFGKLVFEGCLPASD